MSGRPPVSLGRVGRPTRWSGRGWEDHQKGWERSEAPPRGLGGVRRPSGKSGMGREAHPVVR